jgi:hypothetical protein
MQYCICTNIFNTEMFHIHTLPSSYDLELIQVTGNYVNDNCFNNHRKLKMLIKFFILSVRVTNMPFLTIRKFSVSTQQFCLLVAFSKTL